MTFGIDRIRVMSRATPRQDIEPKFTQCPSSKSIAFRRFGACHEKSFFACSSFPLFNRNQGNIRSGQARYGKATVDRESVQNDLTKRLATAYGQYAASKARVERFRKTILPKSEESYKLTSAPFRGGQFEYLRVLQAQRVINEANLTYSQAQLDLWRAGRNRRPPWREDWPFQK